MPRQIIVLNPPSGELTELAGVFRGLAGKRGAEVHTVPDEGALFARLESGLPADLVVVDLEIGDGRSPGVEILAELRRRDPNLPLAAVAGQGDVEAAARAIEAGATDFLVRGRGLKRRVATLLGKLQNLMRLIEANRLLGERNMLLQEAQRARRRIVGESPAIREVVDRAERVARIPRPVLIVGERGTGKELVARAIHAAGGGAGRPFVAVNCAAFPETLLESELFGHERGAFTGAEGVRHGRFEQAKGGTLFLDEIGNMSLAFQRKILRVVEYGLFSRVGGRAEIRTDARTIAATNCDLEEKMARGEFLRDLYDRLAFEVIRVPALRERTGDIEILAQFFLDRFMREIPALRGKRLAHAAVEALKKYRFPGNVRELKNIIERAAYRDVTNEITPEDIGLLAAPAPAAGDIGAGFAERVEDFKRGLIETALAAADGNQAEAARRLDLSYHQFRYHYQKLGAPDDRSVKTS